MKYICCLYPRRLGEIKALHGPSCPAGIAAMTALCRLLVCVRQERKSTRMLVYWSSSRFWVWSAVWVQDIYCFSFWVWSDVWVQDIYCFSFWVWSDVWVQDIYCVSTFGSGLMFGCKIFTMFLLLALVCHLGQDIYCFSFWLYSAIWGKIFTMVLLLALVCHLRQGIYCFSFWLYSAIWDKLFTVFLLLALVYLRTQGLKDSVSRRYWPKDSSFW